MRGGKCNMFSSLGCLLLCGSIALALGNAQKLPKGKRPSLKVHINTTSDSILLKFLRPNPNVKLEGFLLGYGSNLSPNQYFPLPAEGKFTEAVVDAEPKYLIVVRPAPPPSRKKSCSGKARSRKPLQLVVGTLTPSSVFLSWGFLINPHHDWTLPSHCPNDRYYTIRYREKDKEKKWVFQLCPATETIVENLKPNTVYEFGVKDNGEGGIWSKIFNHKTVVGSKKVNGKIQSTYDQVHTVPAYVPRKLIPITIIKQVIQNVTHRASTKSPDKTPFGGTILVHLIIPGLNETTVKLPTSIMLEISDAIKTQLAKNETLALPAESKTPEVEKIPAQPVTVTAESVPRTTKPTVSSALEFSEKTLVLSERTPETLQTILIPRFELPLSTLAPKRLPEFPQANTPFPFEKPEGTLASSEKPWIVPTSKTSEDSKLLPPQTATYDVFSSPATSDEPEMSEPHTATSDPFLDSVPPKTSRTLEQPRATLAPSETPFVPQKLEIFTSPEMPPTTSAAQQTTSIPSTPKRRIRPKPPRTKPERTTSPGTITPKIPKSPEPTWTTLAPSKTQFISLKPKIPLTPEGTPTKPGPGTLETKPSTLAPPKTKRPGRRPRPKTTPSPDVPKSKPALEPATVPLELSVPTIASKPSKRPKTTHRPDAPQIQPDSKPPKQLLPKPQTPAQPVTPPTKPVFEPVTFETEAPSPTIVPATDLEPVTLRTESPMTTLAPKTSQRPRTRRPRPKHKTTPSPAASQSKLDSEPISPGTYLATTTKRPRRPRPKAKTTSHPEVPQTKLVPTTIFEPVILRTEAPVTTLAPKAPQQTHHPRPKPETTGSPEALQTELVPAIVLEPVTPMKGAPGTAFVPVTDLEPVTLRTETSGTILATKTSQRPRRPRPRPKTTPSLQVPQNKSVPATVLEPETPGTTLASETSQQTHRPRPRPKTTPSLEASESKPVPTADLEPVVFRTETWVTTQAPKTSKRTRRPHPKLKTTPTSEAPQTKLVPTTDLEPGPLRTKAPEIVVLPTALEPITLRTKAPETALAPKTVQRTRRPRPRPKTTSSPEAPQTKQVPATSFEPVIHSSEAPETTLAPTELQTLILKPVTSPILEMTQSQPVSEVLESVTLSTESSKEALAPTVTDYLYPSAKTPLSPEEPKTGVVESITNVSEPPETTLETSPLLSQTIIPPSPDEPSTEPAPKQTPRAPPKPKTSPHPRIPQTQPARKVSQHVTSKPKTSPSPEVSYTPPVPRDVLLPPKPDPEVSQSEPVLQPVTFRTDPPETTIAPLETRGSPFIPMISPSTTSEEELQATLAETDQSTQGFFTTRIPLTTELAKTTQAPHRLYTPPVRPRIPDKAHIRPILNKTTIRPSRLKPSRTPKENGMETGVKQAPKPSGAGKNVSVDSTHSTKKPGTRRPPLPPRPVPPRRKPLPPNNVTGKPGSAGIISSVRVTSPPLRATLRPTEAPSERTETDEKQPTAPASGEDLGNITDFSSSPTRETDPLGKPRFKGPHVRYIQKPDNRPCSITDSVKRFPKEDATEGNATSPPQNPPTNLTVVTVEGCPSFVILDWDKPLNDTVTEYEVISRENGSFSGKNKSIQITNQTFSTVENLKPDTSYEFQVKPKNPLGEGPPSNTVAFNTESADPRVSEPISAGRDAIWTERPFNSDSYSECKGKQYVKRTWYKKFVGVQLCNSLRYKIYLSDSLTGKFYNIGDQRGHGEDHCQFVDSFLDGRTGQQLSSDQLPTKEGYFRAVRQEPVQFGEIGGHTQINYVQWYECGTTIPGKW
ncbi:target of Nesh-SH3 isoform X2 [Neomonachus schauinslandi]|uniref:Target of Nesh-SH3 isoform X2 n=1 Tax=Neomonachus schauinslandi TaxID=29088 RepID=A0A8M1MNW1_NEOSC|nr:target of Nesh-SH3 isoform X2 [Neomonachus schauinslandi]